MPFKKTILAILLGTLLFAPIVVHTFLSLTIQQLKHHYERYEAFAPTTITLATSNIEWVDDEKEIMINDKLFDIKSTIIKGDSTICTGWFDDDEALLNEKKSALSKHSTTSKKINDMLFFSYAFFEQLPIYPYSNFKKGKSVFPFYVSTLQNRNLTYIGHPPDVV